MSSHKHSIQTSFEIKYQYPINIKVYPSRKKNCLSPKCCLKIIFNKFILRQTVSLTIFTISQIVRNNKGNKIFSCVREDVYFFIHNSPGAFKARILDQQICHLASTSFSTNNYDLFSIWCCHHFMARQING